MNAVKFSSPSQGEDKGGGYAIYQHQPRNQKLIKHSRRLRKDMTDVERKLWGALKLNQLGVKFRRQYPVGQYIADFACLEKNLIVELDGGQHALRKKYDIERDSFLRAEGFTVLRFWNNEIIENMDGVLDTIVTHITPTLTLPLKRGGDKEEVA